MKSFSISGGPKSNYACLIRDIKWETRKNTEGRKPCEDGGKYLSSTLQAKESQEPPENGRSEKGVSPPSLYRGRGSANTLRLLPSKAEREMKCLLF